MELNRRHFLAGFGAAAAAVAVGCSSDSNPSEAGAVATSTVAVALPVAPARPDHVLFFAGQGPQGLGGRPDLGQTDGYLDNVPITPDGITSYVHLAPDSDITAAADEAFAVYLARPDFADAVVHLSVPWISENNTDDENAALQRQVTDGSLDDAIDELAAWCRSTPHPILLRLGYEYDRQPPEYYDPASYAMSFRYIVDRIRRGGASNVSTVWASTNNPLSLVTPEVFATFYPGDDYVDWFGMSAFVPTLDPLMMQEARGRDKPVLLAESTPLSLNIAEMARFPLVTDDVPGTPLTPDELWNAWFAPTFRMIADNADAIGGFHYISNDWSADSMWSDVFAFAHCDARIWANPEILSRWEAALTSPPFRSA